MACMTVQILLENVLSTILKIGKENHANTSQTNTIDVFRTAVNSPTELEYPTHFGTELDVCRGGRLAFAQ